MSAEYYVKIFPDGNVKPNIYNNESLSWLQSQVGGYIESVPMLPLLRDAGFVMLVNEDGKRNGSAPNDRASRFVKNDTIFGNALILKAKGENFVGMNVDECLEILLLLS